MAAHETPAAVHQHIAATYAARRAAELVAQLDQMVTWGEEGHQALLEWAGRASAVLLELAKG
jgi:hypothetical protein